MEIATLSRLTLLVDHPLIAAGVGLAAFLLFAGLGSLHAQAWLVRGAPCDDAGIAQRIHLTVRPIALVE